jgi:hypothetical protein
MPLDNISPDANGDIYAAGFPNLIQSGKGFDDPYNQSSPVTIWRIRKTVDVGKSGVISVDYRVEKVLEDRDSKVLSGSTTVRHDVKTGRLFISGRSTTLVLESFENDVLTFDSCGTPFPCRLRTDKISIYASATNVQVGHEEGDFIYRSSSPATLDI